MGLYVPVWAVAVCLKWWSSCWWMLFPPAATNDGMDHTQIRVCWLDYQAVVMCFVSSVISKYSPWHLVVTDLDHTFHYDVIVNQSVGYRPTVQPDVMPLCHSYWHTTIVNPLWAIDWQLCTQAQITSVFMTQLTPDWLHVLFLYVKWLLSKTLFQHFLL